MPGRRASSYTNDVTPDSIRGLHFRSRRQIPGQARNDEFRVRHDDIRKNPQLGAGDETKYGGLGGGGAA